MLPQAGSEFWTPEQAAGSIGGQDEFAAREVNPAAGINRRKVPGYLYKGDNRAFPYIAIGKIFVRFSGVSYACTAAVIANQLVLTSRQCVYNTETSQFATDIVFYPGYRHGYNPALGGGWTGKNVLTWSGGGNQFNIGIVQLFNYKLNGCKAKAGSPQIVSFTGHLGTLQGGSYSRRTFNDFGYPAVEISPPAGFNGQAMFECQSPTKGVHEGGYNTVETACDMTAGANGGPWIEHIKPRQGGENNFVSSLTSHRIAGRPNKLEGPQFQAVNFGVLLDAALAEPCN
jgi:V8-like Glu-specific endopeptidase